MPASSSDAGKEIAIPAERRTVLDRFSDGGGDGMDAIAIRTIHGRV
jgi:hypothetical protein